MQAPTEDGASQLFTQVVGACKSSRTPFRHLGIRYGAARDLLGGMVTMVPRQSCGQIRHTRRSGQRCQQLSRGAGSLKGPYSAGLPASSRPLLGPQSACHPSCRHSSHGCAIALALLQHSWLRNSIREILDYHGIWIDGFCRGARLPQRACGCSPLMVHPRRNRPEANHLKGEPDSRRATSYLTQLL